MQAYAAGPVAAWSAADPSVASSGAVMVVDRLWFNEADDSHYFLVPGLIVLVMTIIGAFLTAMVVAREWERGTLEALFVTPMRPGEFLVSKFIPYFALGMIGFALCFLAVNFCSMSPFAARCCCCAWPPCLPGRGVGNRASGVDAGQEPVPGQSTGDVADFSARDDALRILYDLRSMPVVIRGITYALPARYAVTLLQTLYLAGDVDGVIWLNTGVLALMAALLILATRLATRKRLA